ncbi:hypothetical protein HDU76_012042 [Blyttiomyces sp. JEL0837]|nr:hypothetical protein HDU76_012042 [Blyttiomyces sp. JEL0837]
MVSQRKLEAQIWRIAAQSNWTGDLSLLPDLSNFQLWVDIGFDEVVTTKTFYDRLCELKPDSVGIDEIKIMFEGKKMQHIWQVIFKGGSSHLYHSDQKKGILFGSTVTSFCHIAMKHSWPDRLTAFNDLDKVKLFIFAGCYVYFKLFLGLVKDVSQLLSVRDAHDSTGRRYQCLPTIVNIILPAAAAKGSIDIIKFVLEMNNFYSINQYISYALDHALENNHIDIFNMLSSIPGANPEWHKNSHLASACSAGYLNIVKMILDMDDVDAAECEEVVNEAFQLACKGDSDAEGVVKVVLDVNGVDPTAFDNQAIRNAAKRGNYKVVKVLSTVNGIDGGANDNEAIKKACKSGYVMAAKVLLGMESVDPSANDNEALLTTIRRRETKIVKLLVSCDRFDPAANDNEALILAVNSWSRKDRYIQLLKALVGAKGVDPISRDCQAIRSAVDNGWVNGLKVLLGSDALKDMSDEEKSGNILEAEDVLRCSREDGDEESDLESE